MNDLARNYYNSFVRIRDFGVANNNVIKDSAVALANFALVSAGVDAIEASGAVQSSGAVPEGVAQKDFVFAEIRAAMSRINRTARAVG